jgi:hypothetical protein
VQLTRSSVEQATAKGPAEWFTGDVYIDTVAGAADPYRTPHLGRLIQGYAGCIHMTRER